jgi:hypothetical protein
MPMTETERVLAHLKTEPGDRETIDKALALLDEHHTALKTLTSNPHIALGDMVYEVREREGEGWEGPAVKSWGDACSRVDKLVRED